MFISGVNSPNEVTVGPERDRLLPFLQFDIVARLTFPSWGPFQVSGMLRLSLGYLRTQGLYSSGRLCDLKFQCPGRKLPSSCKWMFFAADPKASKQQASARRKAAPDHSQHIRPHQLEGCGPGQCSLETGVRNVPGTVQCL